MKKYIFLILLFCNGCIYINNSYDGVTLTGYLDREFSIYSKSAKIIIKDTVENNIFYEVTFDQVGGGETKLLGFLTISEHHGYKGRRLTVKKGAEEIQSFSVYELTNELEQLDTININLLLKQEN